MTDVNQSVYLCCDECEGQLEEIEELIVDEENRCRFMTYYICENCGKIFNY